MSALFCTTPQGVLANVISSDYHYFELGSEDTDKMARGTYIAALMYLVAGVVSLAFWLRRACCQRAPAEGAMPGSPYALHLS